MDIQFSLQKAMQLHSKGMLIEAKAIYEKVLKKHSRNFDALHNLGLLYFENEVFEESEKFFLKAITVKSDDATAYFNLGRALQGLNKHERAEKSYKIACKYKLNYFDAIVNRTNSLLALERFDEALSESQTAISINPQSFIPYFNKGVSLYKLKLFDDALAIFNEVIKTIPIQYGMQLSDVNNCIGLTLMALDRTILSLYFFNKAISFNSENVEAYYNLGNAYSQLGQFEEALSNYEISLTLKKDFIEVFWHRSLIYLLQGNLEAGFREYEWRKHKKEPIGHRWFPKPLWLGSEDLTDKTILIHAEQGLGDTLQFCRYLTSFANQNVKVIFAPQQPLRKLLSTMVGEPMIVDRDNPNVEFDYHCPLLSLPRAFGTVLETIPGRTPYLAAEPELIEKWAVEIGGHGFKIGVCWQGSVSDIDKGRSFPVAQLERLSNIPGIRLINLHRGEGLSQLSNLPSGMKLEVFEDFDCGPDAFLDTAAIMNCCDLIITSDTAVAHLAGALGLKTWIALKKVPDWRWLLERSDSPWYPSARLFRQRMPGEWDDVFAEMTEELLKLIK